MPRITKPGRILAADLVKLIENQTPFRLWHSTRLDELCSKLSRDAASWVTHQTNMANGGRGYPVGSRLYGSQPDRERRNADVARSEKACERLEAAMAASLEEISKGIGPKSTSYRLKLNYGSLTVGINLQDEDPEKAVARIFLG